MALKQIKQKEARRIRSKYKIRKKIAGTEAKPRISIFKSSLHTYAQAISDLSGNTLVAASTKEQGFKPATSTKSVDSAKLVGELLAKKMQEKGIDTAVFDRNGFKYVGRVKAVAEGMRSAGFKI